MRFLGIVALLCCMGFSNIAAARTATGWKSGRKTKIQLEYVAGVELEASTAAAFRRMAKAARKAGIVLAIRSGFRSHDKQKQLYRRFRNGWGHPAARPGYSNHQNGRAVDIYIGEYRIYEWLRKHAQKFGFKRTVKREAWHWEYVGTARHARRR